MFVSPPVISAESVVPHNDDFPLNSFDTAVVAYTVPDYFSIPLCRISLLSPAYPFPANAEEVFPHEPSAYVPTFIAEVVAQVVPEYFSDDVSVGETPLYPANVNAEEVDPTPPCPYLI